MMRIRQLCGGGLYRDTPYWIETMWCGVTLASAYRWLARCGWGSGFAPLRIRLKGRCWIEDVDRPAVLRADGEGFAGVLPPVSRETRTTIVASRRRRARTA